MTTAHQNEHIGTSESFHSSEGQLSLGTTASTADIIPQDNHSSPDPDDFSNMLHKSDNDCAPYNAPLPGRSNFIGTFLHQKIDRKNTRVVLIATTSTTLTSNARHDWKFKRYNKK